MNSGCSVEVEEVLNEIRGCLQRLELTSINSDDPIASGILDISEGVDNVSDILSAKTKQILTDVELNESEFSNDVNIMLDEFVNIYNLLGPDLDPALAAPISFPRNEYNLSKRRTLLTTFDLLEGL